MIRRKSLYLWGFKKIDKRDDMQWIWNQQSKLDRIMSCRSICFHENFYILLSQSYSYILRRMNRGIRNQPKNSKYDQNQLSQIKSVSLLLDHFLHRKIADNLKHFFDKIKTNNLRKKKYGTLLSMILAGLASRKTKQYKKHAYRKLQSQMVSERAKILKDFSEVDQKVKQKSANLISLIYNKLYQTKLRQNFKLLLSQTRNNQNTKNFKMFHIARIFNQLLMQRYRTGFQKLRAMQMRSLFIKNKFIFIEKLITAKLHSNLFSAFLKLRANAKSQSPKTQQNPKPQVKPNPRRTVEPRVEPVQQQNRQQRQIDEKTQQLQNQINTLQRQKQRAISEHNKEIKKYENEQQSLRFNNDLLDQSIKQLENELMQRQKKNVKKLSNTELWDRVYSNLLFVYSNSGGSITREQLLEALECPLAPINVDIDAMRMENQVLSELIQEYKKFYESSHDNIEAREDLLPYDILVAKNKFLFSAMQALIEQGIGTEKQIKQLSEDIENLAKSS